MTVPSAQGSAAPAGLTPDGQPFTARLTAVAARIDALLTALLSDTVQPGELARPPRLMAAMRHAALAGGKRLRPFLVIENRTAIWSR